MAISTPTLHAAVPNWRVGDLIALSAGRSLRVIDTRLREDSDGDPVMVLIVVPASLRAGAWFQAAVEAVCGGEGFRAEAQGRLRR
jgi:hypothetical protein